MIATEISPEVSALVEAFNAIPPGGIITYTELSAAIGRDVRSCYWMVMSAQTVAAREHGAVFANQRNVGFQRLTTEELHTVGHTARAKIRRRSRKAAKLMRQGTARANELSPIAARKINAELSALAMLEYAAGDKIAKPRDEHDTRPEPIGITAKRLMEALQAAV